MALASSSAASASMNGLATASSISSERGEGYVQVVLRFTPRVQGCDPAPEDGQRTFTWEIAGEQYAPEHFGKSVVQPRR